jgi:hypothetical protein
MILMDRWRSGMHMFHLPCGETTVTLPGIVIILGLLIDGTPVCGMVSSVGWRDSVREAIGNRPHDIPTGQKDKKTTGVHFGWLTYHFNTCSYGVEDAVIQMYVLSCVWHMDDE